MKIDDLNETPRLISDNDYEPEIQGLDVTDADDNRTSYLKVSSSNKRTHVEYYQGNALHEIVRYGDKYVLLNHDSKTIDYYVKVEEGSYRVLGKWACQVEVWRERLSPLTAIVSHIVETYIMPKHGIIISDSLQTSMGQELWARLGVRSLTNGYFVYAYDRNNGTIHNFPTVKEYRSNMQSYYGDTSKFEKIRLVISSKNINE